jgi:hypothetical protein
MNAMYAPPALELYIHQVVPTLKIKQHRYDNKKNEKAFFCLVK